MKITKLMLVAIFWLPIYCSLAQTNSESDDARFFRETYNATTWGRATNGIQFGILVSAIGKSVADKFKVFTFLDTTNKAGIYGLWKLPPEYRFEEITLKTKDGEEIKKTSKGNALCKAPLFYISDGNIVVLNPTLLEDFGEPFDPRDCFNIKKAGTYILTVKARLYSTKSYHEFAKLDIPPASVEIVLKDSDLEN